MIQAYVINLESRPDRWSQVVEQSDLLNLKITRIPGLPSSDFDGEFSLTVTAPVKACWEAHRLAAREFLDTNDSHALILEDDFLLSKSFSHLHFELALKHKFDFVQIGFLKTSPFVASSILFFNFTDTLLRVFGILKEIPFLKRFLKNKLLILERLNIPSFFVMNDIRPGAHAYVISRKFAEHMLLMNDPTYLSTDALYIALGPMRTFKMGRLRKSVITQRQSVSSITSRFISFETN